jgi:hypothetical protein
MTFVDLDDDDDDQEDFQQGQSPEELIKALRQTAKNQSKELKKLRDDAAKNSESTKKLAFIEAKLPESPQTKFFLDKYEGEYTAEAIRAAAAEYGFIPPDPTVDNEIGTVEAMMQASSGAGQIAAPGTDADLMSQINAVSATGPAGAAEIRQILERAGRWQSDE